MAVKTALRWTIFWITLASLFCLGIYFKLGAQSAEDFVASYLVEQSLSMDNLFVFLIVFRYFGTASIQQRSVLLWGFMGAAFLRAVFIFGGLEAIKHFEWLIYLMGAFLVYLGLKVLFQKDERVDPAKNPVVKLARKFLPITPHYHDRKFFVRVGHKWNATPLILVLLAIETTDLIFAFDSVPAVFSVTRDPFIVYTSNLFAILGLRSLYFLIAQVMHNLPYVRHGISLILCLVGVKLILSPIFTVPTGWMLGSILAIFGVSVSVSIYAKSNA